MTVENISWSISTNECCRPRQGLNRHLPPGLQSDGASNWATEAGTVRLTVADRTFGRTMFFFTEVLWVACSVTIMSVTFVFITSVKTVCRPVTPPYHWYTQLSTVTFKLIKTASQFFNTIFLISSKSHMHRACAAYSVTGRCNAEMRTVSISSSTKMVSHFSSVDCMHCTQASYRLPVISTQNWVKGCTCVSSSSSNLIPICQIQIIIQNSHADQSRNEIMLSECTPIRTWKIQNFNHAPF